MPVYNAAEFLREAVESIRRQTYPWWELLCMDDGSSDGSGDALEKLAAGDGRIRVLRNGTHRGLVAAIDAGLREARGEFIARVDADDVASPERLEKQVSYLLAHPAVVAVGGQVLMTDRNGAVTGEKRFPTAPEAVRRMMFSSMPLQHGAMLVHRGRLPSGFVWYEEGTTPGEDVGLLFRLLRCGELANIGETVLRYRIHGNNVSLRHPKRTFFLTLRARFMAIVAYGYRPTVTGLLVSLSQAVAVALLPARWVYPAYALVQRQFNYATFIYSISRSSTGSVLTTFCPPLAA